MTELIMPVGRLSAGGAARNFAGLASKAFAGMRRRLSQRRTLAELRSLDSRTLHDIGIHRTEIESIVYNGGYGRLRGR
jgi:uncharacterized protein YjiS (DUF1127 family)